MLDVLYSRGSVGYEELVGIGCDHVPPGIAIRKYRTLYEWENKRATGEHKPNMLERADQQIRSGARRVVVKAVWEMRLNGSVEIHESDGRKTVEMTDTGREKVEYRRRFE